MPWLSVLATRHRDREAEVFVSVIGQCDNLGDSLLRRHYVDALRPHRSLHVLVGKMEQGYLSGFALDGEVVFYRSVQQWAWTAFTTSLRRRVVLAMFAGELPVGLVNWIRFVFVGVLVRWLRLVGGAGLMAGVGIRTRSSIWLRLALRWMCKPCEVVVWRDDGSRVFVGLGNSGPDWGFTDEDTREFRRAGVLGTTEPRRHLLGVSLRGDGPYPGGDLLVGLKQYARDAGLQIVTISQVRGDNARAFHLGLSLNAVSIVQWNEDNHADHERVLRELYRQCEAVISDRLHVLVLGATEGAVPIGLGKAGGGKIGRTFEAAGMTDVVLPSDLSGSTNWSLSILKASRRRADTAACVEIANRRLDVMRQRIRGVLTATPAEKGSISHSGPDVDPLQVLLALSPPDGTTRYVDQIVSGVPTCVSLSFLSIKGLLARRIDVFHLHWPEYLVAGSSPMRRTIKAGFALCLLAYLRVRRVAIVRTIHNVGAHDAVITGWQNWVLRLWERSTVLHIRINATTSVDSATPLKTILHGHYRDRFSDICKPRSAKNRVLYFGLIRPYKGVDRLLNVFVGEAGSEFSLRIVGKPVDPRLAQEVVRQADVDSRVGWRFGFVPDVDLVSEVSLAEVVVLPYTEMHNSGALLVALSLDRPVVVPKTPVNEALSREVGPGWVTMYTGEFTWASVLEALGPEMILSRRTRPCLDARDWEHNGVLHRAAYLEAVTRRPSRMVRRAVMRDTSVGTGPC